jgi:hypothetical protein
LLKPTLESLRYSIQSVESISSSTLPAGESQEKDMKSNRSFSSYGRGDLACTARVPGVRRNLWAVQRAAGMTETLGTDA